MSHYSATVERGKGRTAAGLFDAAEGMANSIVSKFQPVIACVYSYQTQPTDCCNQIHKLLCVQQVGIPLSQDRPGGAPAPPTPPFVHSSAKVFSLRASLDSSEPHRAFSLAEFKSACRIHSE